MNLERSNKNLKNNIIYSSMYQVLIMIVPVLTTPYVTRIFSVDQMGNYNLSYSIASFFVIISQFGIETYGSREIAKSDNNINRDQIFFHLISLQTLISILSFVLYSFLFLFLFKIESSKLYFIQSLLILVNIFDISWYFIGIEEIKKTIFRNALTKIFTTLLIFIFIKTNNQLEMYALINVIGMLIGNLTMILSSNSFINYNNRFFRIEKEQIRSSFKLLIPRVLNSSYTTLERSILSISTSSSNVGVYSEANKIINLIFSIIDSSINALSPRMSYYVSNNNLININKTYIKGLKYSSFFSIIFVSGVFSVATDFVDFFFGMGYEQIAPVLKITSFSLIIIPITSLYTRGVLVPFSRDKEFSVSIILKLIGGVILNLVLAPQYGALGAGVSFNIVELISFIYLLIITKELVNPLLVLKNVLTTFLYIIVNIFLVHIVTNLVIFESSIISFLIHGFVSVLISMVLILIKKYITKFK